jgi:hypothetical protein
VAEAVKPRVLLMEYERLVCQELLCPPGVNPRSLSLKLAGFSVSEQDIDMS